MCTCWLGLRLRRGGEHDASGCRVGVFASGGAGPDDALIRKLPGSPAVSVRDRGMLERVMREAEVREVADLGASALRVVVVVVDLAVVDGSAAAGEAAVLVACAQVAAHGLSGRVRVGLSDEPAWIQEQARPPGAGAGQGSGDVGMER